MKIIKIHSHSQDETIRFGRSLAKHLNQGDILCLFGDLGSGKTTLVKGIAQGLRINPEQVNSPTFVLLNIYQGRLPLFHFDFYRLNKPEELFDIGYDEFLFGDGVAVVEWAERFGPLQPEENLCVQLSSKKEHERLFKITAKGKRYVRLMEQFGVRDSVFVNRKT